MNKAATPDEERFERIMQWHMRSVLFGSAYLSKEDSDWLKTHSLEGVIDNAVTEDNSQGS